MGERPEENMHLQEELRQAIGTLQIKDHKMEDLPEENRRLLEGWNKPKLTISRTRRPREGSRSCMPLPQGAGSGLQRAAGDHVDPHAEEGTKEEKRTLSLLDMVRKALETASVWALSLLGVAW